MIVAPQPTCLPLVGWSRRACAGVGSRSGDAERPLLTRRTAAGVGVGRLVVDCPVTLRSPRSSTVPALLPSPLLSPLYCSPLPCPPITNHQWRPNLLLV
jgi:hypothetical protein